MKLCQMARDGKKRRKLACMARFFAVRQQGGEASGHAYNRRTLSGRYVRIQKKGLSPKRKPLNLLERETGFEPATSTLARLHSTTELLPHTGTVCCDRFLWRRHPDLNWRITVLQTVALPLGYVAVFITRILYHGKGRLSMAFVKLFFAFCIRVCGNMGNVH